jgi:hypothetical protein
MPVDPNSPMTGTPDTEGVAGSPGAASLGTAATVGSTPDLTLTGGGGGGVSAATQSATIDTAATTGGALSTPTSTALAGTLETIAGGGAVKSDANPAYVAPTGPSLQTGTLLDSTRTDSPVSGLVQITNQAFVAATDIATIDTDRPHNLSVGQAVTVGGINANLNGTWTVATTPTATRFTFLNSVYGSDITSAAVVGGGYIIPIPATNMTGTIQTPDIGAVSQGSTATTLAPTGVSAVANADGTVTVSWTAPAPISGSPTTSFEVEGSRGARQGAAANVTSVVIPAWKLEPSVGQTFTVAARNRNGLSPKSAASASVSPRAVDSLGYTGLSPLSTVDPVYNPDGSIKAGTGNAPGTAFITTTAATTATATWTAPATTATAPDLGYTLSIYQGGVFLKTQTVGAGVLTAAVTGLTSGQNVYFSVQGNWARTGLGAPSVASNTILNGAPNRPTGVTATAMGSGNIKIDWTLPTVGAAFTTFTVVLYVNGVAQTPNVTANPTLITKTIATTVGATVYATVTAANAVGAGMVSAVSNSVVIT